jgi:hypothetical protein
MPAARSPRSHSLREPSLLGSFLACGVSALRVSIACATDASYRTFGILSAAKDPSGRLHPAGILRCAQDDEGAWVLELASYWL